MAGGWICWDGEEGAAGLGVLSGADPCVSGCGRSWGCTRGRSLLNSCPTLGLPVPLLIEIPRLSSQAGRREGADEGHGGKCSKRREMLCIPPGPAGAPCLVIFTHPHLTPSSSPSDHSSRRICQQSRSPWERGPRTPPTSGQGHDWRAGREGPVKGIRGQGVVLLRLLSGQCTPLRVAWQWLQPLESAGECRSQLCH